ncbi:MAG: arginine repressor [Bacteroidia bacterium]|nr:arginine repressor [Bacteroidia bacterium]
MKNKEERFELIKQIISGEVISNQDDLQLRLHAKGMEVTQATLSRDLKLLQVIKVSDAKAGYAYRLPSHDLLYSSQNESTSSRLNFLADGVLGIEFSGNLGVIKTLPGFASSTALAIDESGCKEILGTIAGDDTILVVIRDGVGRNDVTRALVGIMPKLENRI